MKFFLGIVFFLSCFFAGAQEVFQKYFSEPIEYLSLRQTASDSGFVLAGSKFSTGTVYDFIVVKIDKKGNVLWSKEYPSSNDDFLSSLTTSPSEELLLSGYKSTSTGSYDFSMLKTNASGNAAWHKTYGNSKMEITVLGGETSLGEYFLSGNRDMMDDPVVIKTDNSGNILWSKTFGTTNFERVRVSAVTDNGMVLAGDLSSQFFLMKLDGNGTINWANTYASLHPQFFTSIKQTSDKGFILSSTDYRCDTSGCFPFVAFMKTDSAGDVLWTKAIEGFYGWGKNAIETKGGGFAVTGQLTDTSVNDKNSFLLKTDSNGNLLWAKSYGIIGTSGESVFVENTPDGGYILLGTENSNAHLIKTDASGNSGCNEQAFYPVLSSMSFVNSGGLTMPVIQIADTSGNISAGENSITVFDSTICSSGIGIAEHGFILEAHVFPNPFSESATISVGRQELEAGKLELKIFDVYGKEIRHSELRTSNSRLERGDLASGIYFYKLEGENGAGMSGKLMIE